MLAKTGLLVVSNPNHIGKILSSIQKSVQNTLYIKILTSDSSQKASAAVRKYSQTISGIYSQAAKHCSDLDVRIILSNLKHTNLLKIHTQKPIDLLIFDKSYNETEINTFLDSNINNKTEKCDFVVVEVGPTSEEDTKHESGSSGSESKLYAHTVLGGTFDRLHIAHRVLLSEAALRSYRTVTVGVTEESMLKGKLLWELIEPIQKRMNDVRDFLKDICPELEINVVPITDAFGPTKEDPTMDLLIVSAETLNGAKKVNEVRAKNGLRPLEIHSVDLIDEPFPGPKEEPKISSSTSRLRLLGTVINPVVKNELIPKRPYIIGLTGGIASGKSGVARRLAELGAKVIDCDKIGHDVYKLGKPCYYGLLKEFSDKIKGENGEIDRKVLGGIVFSDPVALEKLNAIVWPAIAEEVFEIIKKSDNEVVVIEAAILLKAGWQKYCHEIWTTMVPETEVVIRLKSRNGLNEEQALSRIKSQEPNKRYVERSNVVFCTLWEVAYTRQQVDRAWRELKKRMLE